MTEHTEWCRKHFAAMRHGGLWLIPRSGLVIRKTANALLWVGVVPTDKVRRRVPQPLLDEMREVEFEENRKEFDEAGVPMLKAHIIRTFNTFDDAREHYGMSADEPHLVVRNIP